jgi:hypothetical protein
VEVGRVADVVDVFALRLTETDLDCWPLHNKVNSLRARFASYLVLHCM